MLPWIPLIVDSAPEVFALLKQIFAGLSIVPIVGPFFAIMF